MRRSKSACIGTRAVLVALVLSVASPIAVADDGGPEAAAPDAPAAGGRSALPAKTLFGAAKTPAELKPRAIGFYSRGCLAGARPLDVDGAAWQAMRLSRNRNWGHPELIRFLESFAVAAQKHDGWPGLLVGDLSQPRGGPMLTGHNSHQVGLDADIWFTPMPAKRLSMREREDLSATSMLGSKTEVDPAVWTPAHARIVKRAASYPQVERIFVHPAIKKAMCDWATGDRGWLAKVRPYWGHHYHFHVRIKCPEGSEGCKPQTPPSSDDGCGKELDDWFRLLTAPPNPFAPPPKPRPPVTLADLPSDCRVVLNDRSAAKQAGPQSGTATAR